MAPFFRYPPPDVSPASLRGLAPLVTQIMMISVLMGTFFRVGNSIISTTLSLFLVGLLFEVSRRSTDYLTDTVMNCFMICKSFREGKPEYDWIVMFLTQEKALPQSFATYKDLLPNNHSRNFWWKGKWIQVTVEGYPQYDYPTQGETMSWNIHITIYTFKTIAMSNLIEEAKRRYVDVQAADVVVYSTTSKTAYSGRFWDDKRQKPCPSLDSTSLSPGDLDSLVQDAREFLESEDWYAATGVPYRKGYLLHGPPGTRKSTAVYALAGKLGREIYSLSLTASSLSFDDSNLVQAMSSVPKGSIFLLENIDHAFPSVSEKHGRNGGCFGSPYGPHSSRPTGRGILNILDGVSREEGILFFATTENVDLISSDLFCPGRLDKKIEFTYTAKDQAKRIFDRFFPTRNDIPKSDQLEDSQDSKTLLLDDLAEQFSSQIPENEFTIRDLQHYLLPYRSTPMAAVSGIKGWVGEKLEEKRVRLETEAKEAEKAKALGTGACPCCGVCPPPVGSYLTPQWAGSVRLPESQVNDKDSSLDERETKDEAPASPLLIPADDLLNVTAAEKGE
ncbi:P-loop containing nucleoside triphosphate hydrolase protein [Flammula alnicola]|nr:P-loop containing nucleoside triphosphate hydrolase protein [Flammula alnicola]